MKSVTASTAPARSPLKAAADPAWRERSGRLFAEFERPARAMIRRAFRGAFCDDELDDIYASAWVGTLRALADRHAGLADDEIRSYLLTAVANQAGKELRRRRRKPTAPLELIASVPDNADSPEEQAASGEQSRVTRDLLVSLPPRRRAVMLLRYGWGLEPSQVCSLIGGLSPRAYRKEITRGVDELAEKMRAVEAGEWCREREPVLRSFVSGLAGEEEKRQARAHLAHCRHCVDFVTRLSGHLHDLGGVVATTATIDGLDGQVAFGDRLVEIGDRLGGLASRGGSAAADEATTAVSTGGARGTGAAGAGIFTKLAGLGTAGKLAIACAGGGIAATACVAAGVAPLGLGRGSDDEGRPAVERPATTRSHASAPTAPSVSVETLPSQIDNQHTPPPPSTPAPSTEAQSRDPVSEAAGSATSEAAPAPTVAPTAPPTEQEFGVAAAAAPPPASQATSPSSAASGGGSEPASSGSAVHQEFGP